MIWFSTNQAHTIGIIMGKSDVDDTPKAHIGLGNGKDEGTDAKLIADHGVEITKVMAQDLSKHFKEKGKKM